MPTILKANCQVLKYLSASIVLADPPYGYQLASWDHPEDVWDSEYWTQLLQSLLPVLKRGTLLCVFGDCFNVLPPLAAAIQEWNTTRPANAWVSPTQIVCNKQNHPNKGSLPYASSAENAFLFWYEQAPPIGKHTHELGGNVISSSKILPSTQIQNLKGEPLNPCQKPYTWLKILIENHAMDDTLVLDLTCGSFSSFLPVYTSNKAVHWVGSDKGLQTLENWEEFLDNVTNETDSFQNLVGGMNITNLFDNLAQTEEFFCYLDSFKLKGAFQELRK